MHEVKKNNDNSIQNQVKTKQNKTKQKKKKKNEVF